MPNEFLSPYFNEDVAKYNGKDFVHYGVRVPFHSQPSFSRRAERMLKKCNESLPHLETKMFIGGVMDDAEKELTILKTYWFDQNDKTFPDKIVDGQYLLAVYNGDEIIGGAVLTESYNNLFLHQLISREQEKELGLPTYIIYKILEYFSGAPKYHALDIGVSYRKTLYEFFENFAVEKYPVILQPPFYKPMIRFAPMTRLPASNGDPEKGRELLNEIFGNNYTIFPRAAYAIYGILKHLGLGKEDVVGIDKTFWLPYLSKCFTNSIEAVCKWKIVRTEEEAKDIKALFVLHEFGYPYYRDLAFKLKGKVPIIENSIWSFYGQQKNGVKFGGLGDYTIFSLSKTLPLQFGGILQGISLEKQWLWDNLGCLDEFKEDLLLRQLSHFSREEISYYHDERITNWLKFNKLVQDDGMLRDDCYDLPQDYYPAVYLLRVDKHPFYLKFAKKLGQATALNVFRQKLAEYGIEAGSYYGEPIIYFPMRHPLSNEGLEYMFGVVKGLTNLCYNYKKI